MMMSVACSCTCSGYDEKCVAIACVSRYFSEHSMQMKVNNKCHMKVHSVNDEMDVNVSIVGRSGL